jgi:hypothetical protein
VLESVHADFDYSIKRASHCVVSESTETSVSAMATNCWSLLAGKRDEVTRCGSAQLRTQQPIPQKWYCLETRIMSE